HPRAERQLLVLHQELPGVLPGDAVELARIGTALSLASRSLRGELAGREVDAALGARLGLEVGLEPAFGTDAAAGVLEAVKIEIREEILFGFGTLRGGLPRARLGCRRLARRGFEFFFAGILFRGNLDLRLAGRALDHFAARRIR